MVSVWDRAAIMVGLEAGLSQVRIARRVGRSPSVVCRQIARHRGSDGDQAQGMPGERRRWPGAAIRKRLLDAGMVLRRVTCLSRGRTPRQNMSARVGACGTVAPIDDPSSAQGRDQLRGYRHVDGSPTLRRR